MLPEERGLSISSIPRSQDCTTQVRAVILMPLFLKEMKEERFFRRGQARLEAIRQEMIA
jgi:hypothetical protein